VVSAGVGAAANLPLPTRARCTSQFRREIANAEKVCSQLWHCVDARVFDPVRAGTPSAGASVGFGVLHTMFRLLLL